MMWSEFIEGTGCKATEYNYKVFENLEAMYMNTNMSKAEVYGYGKKLVDNSKTKEEIEFEEKIKTAIAECKQMIEWYKGDIEMFQGFLENMLNTTEQEESYIHSIKWRKESIKGYRRKIKDLKFVLALA